MSELAERAGLGFASASPELRAMQRLRLVDSRHEGGKEVLFANPNHPQADLLRSLVSSETQHGVASTPEDEELKGKLKALGAPLRGVEPVTVDSASEVETLVAGVQLARRDPVVAKTLPLLFWAFRDRLDGSELAKFVSSPEEKHALGFFLELTSKLGRDRRLLGMAERFQDKRMTTVRDFFQMGSKSAAARAEGFPLAEKWKFRMNTDLDAFRSLFSKFAAEKK